MLPLRTNGPAYRLEGFAVATHVSPLDIDFDTIDTSRYEYIDGQLIERPVPKPLHSRVQGTLIEVLGPKARSLGCRFGPELSVDKENRRRSEWLTPDNALYHDPPRTSPGGNALPDDIELVVEVLSPEQTMQQMRQKAQSYFKWGLQTVWIIDPENKVAEIHRNACSPVTVRPGEDLCVVFRDGKTSIEIPFVDLLG